MTKKLFLTANFSGGGAESVLVQLANHFSSMYDAHYGTSTPKRAKFIKIKFKNKII